MNNQKIFGFDCIGNIAQGREHLGEAMPVSVYRMFQFAIRMVLEERYGDAQAIEIFRETGYKSGVAFADEFLDVSLDIGPFFAQLQQVLRQYQVGILRIEQYDEQTGNAVLTIAEDLDCSGLHVTGKTVCNYDEGFIAGLLFAYTGKPYTVLETDCWASGARECRFFAKQQENAQLQEGQLHASERLS